VVLGVPEDGAAKSKHSPSCGNFYDFEPNCTIDSTSFELTAGIGENGSCVFVCAGEDEGSVSISALLSARVRNRAASVALLCRGCAGLRGTSRGFAGLRGTLRDAGDARKETFFLLRAMGVGSGEVAIS
jgi:hypothetical protein